MNEVKQSTRELTKVVIKAIKQAQLEAYNEAIEDAAETLGKCEAPVTCMCELCKESNSILKLLKK